MFTTKKYTRPLLIAELRKLKANNFVNAGELFSALSPRAGHKSAKVAALKSFLGGKLNKAFATKRTSTKTLLIRYLKD